MLAALTMHLQVFSPYFMHTIMHTHSHANGKHFMRHAMRRSQGLAVPVTLSDQWAQMARPLGQKKSAVEMNVLLPGWLCCRRPFS